MLKIKKIIHDLIKENTGVSSRSALLVWSMIYTSFLTLHFVLLDWFAFLFRAPNNVNYTGWGIICAGIATVILAVVYGKSMKDKYNQQKNEEN